MCASQTKIIKSLVVMVVVVAAAAASGVLFRKKVWQKDQVEVTNHPVNSS